MTRPTAVKLARASWIIPIVAFLAGLVLRYLPADGAAGSAREQGRAEGAACAFLVFYWVGLVLAIVALTAGRRHGPADIRGPAVLGLALNAILLVLAVVILFVGDR